MNKQGTIETKKENLQFSLMFKLQLRHVIRHVSNFLNTQCFFMYFENLALWRLASNSDIIRLPLT